jgi:hypothetical protein
MLLSRPVFTTLELGLAVVHPSIRTLGERLMRSVHIGVLDTAGAAI